MKRTKYALMLFLTFIILLNIYEHGEIMKTIGWNGKNREILSEFIKKNRCDNCKTKPVAVFDWDNTVVFNDIGDYFFKWMLENNLFRFNPWEDISPYFTDKAIDHLNKTCKNEKGFIDGTKNDCFELLNNIYTKGVLPDGSDPFSGYDPDLYQPAYALLAHMFAGYAEHSMKILCEQAVKEAQKEEEVFIYPEMEWLINELADNGFDVWVITASPELLVASFAKKVGIKAENVIGIRNVVENGIITADLKGCGTFKDGENRMMTYRIGKRCWMNEIIFGITGEAAMTPAEDISKRPLFVAGDSDTDYHFMIDATGLRLLINREKPEITKEAFENKDGLWIINELFIKK